MFVLILFLLFVTWYVFRVRKYKELDKYPGPSAFELLKFMLFSKSNNDVYNYLVNLNNRFGSVVRVWIKPFKPALMVSDLTFVENILIAPDHIHKTDLYNLFAPILGYGLFNIPDDNAWKKERRALGYAFNLKSIQQYTLRYQIHTTKLLKCIDDHISDPIDVQDLTYKYSMDVIFDLLMKEQLNTQDGVISEVIESIDVFRDSYLERAYSLYKKNDTIYKFMGSYERFSKSCQYVRKFIEGILQKHININHTTENAKTDFLTLLLGCNLPYIRTLDHLITFLLAGADTTARAISFTLFELAKHRRAQERIFEEYNAIVGDNAEVKFSDIQEMTYTEGVIKEAMRLYPPIPIIQRKLQSPVTIDGNTIPDGTDVMFCILSIHNSEKYYKNPLEFDPERFQKGNVENIHPNVHLPFSGGPRDCIGKRIATTEMKYIVSYLVKHYELYPVYPEHKLDIVGQFTMDSTNGAPIMFKRRVT